MPAEAPSEQIVIFTTISASGMKPVATNFLSCPWTPFSKEDRNGAADGQGPADVRKQDGLVEGVPHFRASEATLAQKLQL
jgi:hypothetical protein